MHDEFRGYFTAPRMTEQLYLGEECHYHFMDPFVSEISSQHIWETQEWEALKAAVPSIEKLHLRQLLQVENSIKGMRERMRTVLTSFRLNMTISRLTIRASGLLLRLK